MLQKTFIILMLGLAASQQAHAQDTQEDLKAVYAREDIVNQLSLSMFTQELVLKDLLSPETGVEAQLQTANNDISKWISVFRTLDSELASLPQLTDVEQKVTLTLRNQSLDLTRIQGRLASINQLCDKSLTNLTLSSKSGSAAETDSVRSDLDERRKNLSVRLNNAKEATFTLGQKLNDVRRLLNYDLFYAKILNEAVKRGIEKNSPIVVGYSNYLRAELLAGTYYGSLFDKITRHSLVMLNMEGNRSRDLLNDLKKDQATIIASINASTLVKSEKDRLIGEVTDMLNKVVKDYQTTILIYKPAVLAQSMQKAKVRKNRLICSKPNAGTRCQMYKQVKDISPDRIAAYDDKGIAELEKMWKAVEE